MSDQTRLNTEVETVERHLALAEKRMVNAETNIGVVRRTMSKLHTRQETAVARGLLRVMKQTREAMARHRDHIRERLQRLRRRMR